MTYRLELQLSVTYFDGTKRDKVFKIGICSTEKDAIIGGVMKYFNWRSLWAEKSLLSKNLTHAKKHCWQPPKTSLLAWILCVVNAK